MNIEELDKETKAIEDRVAAVEQRVKEADEAKFNGVAKGNSMSHPVIGRTSDESRALSYFGVSHVKDLLDVNTGADKFRDVPNDLKYLVLELKKDIDVCRMTRQIVGGEPQDRHDNKNAVVKGMLDSYYGKHVLAPRLKAFGSTVTGAGDEWVPTAVSSQYMEEYHLERDVARQFRQVNMTGDPMDFPVMTNLTKARIQLEGQGIASANFGTSTIRLDAIKLTEFMALTEELREDSAPDILAIVRSEVVEAQIRAVESAIINGDEDGTHQDADTQALGPEVAEKAWDGLRKLGLANSANGGTKNFGGVAATLANVRSMRASLGKYGVNSRDLVYIMSTRGYNALLTFPEVSTYDKFGPSATILNGSLAALDGIPIVISEFVRDDLAATGVNTALGPNTFGTMLLVNRRRFFFGVRRPIRVKAVMNPTPPNDEWLVCSWWRGDFRGHPQSATEVSVVVGYNIA